MAKIKSISIVAFDKATETNKPMFASLDMKMASALAQGSKFGSIGIKNLETEVLDMGGKAITKIKGFDFVKEGETSTTNLTFEKINFEFETKEGKAYDMHKTIFRGENGLNNSTSNLLKDISKVARAGFLGNEGKKFGEEGFYTGDVNVFTKTYYVTVDDTNKETIVPEGTDGAQKRTGIDKVDPREVAAANEFLAARKEATPEIETPTETDVGEIER